MKLWDSAWYFKCLFSPFSRDLLLYSRSLFHLQLFLCSSACFLGKLAELGLVEQDCDFVRVQQRWGICGLVQFFSLLSRSFLILVGGTCPNFLDNNSQATCMEQLWWLQGIFALTYLRPLKLLAVAPLKLGLYLSKGDSFCFHWWLAKLSLRWALIFSASVVFRWNVSFSLLQAECTPPTLCLNQQLVVFFLGETKINPGWSHPSIKPILSSSPWFLWFITSSSLFLHGERRDFQPASDTLSHWDRDQCDPSLLSPVQALGFTWLRYILLNLQVNLLQVF